MKQLKDLTNLFCIMTSYFIELLTIVAISFGVENPSLNKVSISYSTQIIPLTKPTVIPLTLSVVNNEDNNSHHNVTLSSEPFALKNELWVKNVNFRE
jgi:hypothetical protein